MQRTLKRESKVLEIVKRETAGARKNHREQSETFHGGEGLDPPLRRRLEATSSVRRRGPAAGTNDPLDGVVGSVAGLSLVGERASVARAGQRRSSQPSGRDRSPEGVSRRAHALATVQLRAIAERPLDRGEAHWKRAAARPGVGPPQGGAHLSARLGTPDGTALTDPS